MGNLAAADLDFIRRAIAPAAVGPVSFRVEPGEEGGAPVAEIHVFGAYDCKGTEAEVTGLLKGSALRWRLVWH